jgi:3-oxoacyl-(acyl-carrier-protein) synthase
LAEVARDTTQTRTLNRFSLFAVYTAQQAVDASTGALEDLTTEHGGVFMGTGLGGTLSMDSGYETLYGEGSDRINPLPVLQGMHNEAAAWIGMDHGRRARCKHPG